MKSLYIAVDFDGTVVEHKYPEIGEPIEEALEVIHELMQAGHKIILHTMRSGDRLTEAVEYLEDNGVILFGINENKSQKYWTTSPKVFANLYIDDCAVGCPVIDLTKARRSVDWYGVREWLVEVGVL